MDGSPPESSVHGILQARILEWIAMPSSRGSGCHALLRTPFPPQDQTRIFRSTALAGRFSTTSTTWEDPLRPAAAKLLQSCPTLCDPIDGSPPGSAIPGILQARTLEWVAILLQCMKVKSESEVTQLCPTLGDPIDCSLPGSSCHGILQARALEWAASAFPKNSTMCKRLQPKESRYVTQVFFPRKSHGLRSLVVCTIHGVTNSQTQLSMHEQMSKTLYPKSHCNVLQ